MKGFKGFDEGLKCKNFQYEEGKKYKHDGAVELCKEGFHFCENPFDVLDYYDLTTSEFAEIEALGEIKKDASKSVTNHIKIVKKIVLKDFITSAIDFLNVICKIRNSGNFAKIASSGDAAQLASSGYAAQLASSGDAAQLASSGDAAKLASSGDA
ncbi:MAG: hypothetical protein M0Q46_06135, partial [Endomicrobiales bacterium]|nr:hypothetical protein [Endomicrobiales bacterium]